MKLPVNYKNLSPKERKIVREEYIKIQKGNCYFCKEKLSEEPEKKVKLKKINHNLFPKGFFDWPVHLHHNHKTGLTIGAVHNYCNAVLWQYFGE